MNNLPLTCIAAFFVLSTPGSAFSTTKLHSTSIQTSAASTSGRYDDLLDWLESNGAEVNEKIEIKPSPLGGGFGAFVSDSIEKDELLFTVPRQACFTLKDAMEDPFCGEAFGNLIKRAGSGGDTVVMAGYMAKEYLIEKENDESDKCRFGAYFSTLPWERGINNQEHVLFWSEEDVEKYLKDSLSYKEAVELRDEVDLAINVLNNIVGPQIVAAREKENDSEAGFSWPWEPKEPKVVGIVEGLPEAVKGAFVCLLTRSFQDDGDDEKLVPMLDMLQHCDEPNVSHAMRKTDGTVEVRAKRSLEDGEELLNQYRSEREENMPYHRFFTRFGFVPGIKEEIRNLLQDRSSIFYPQTAEI